MLLLGKADESDADVVRASHYFHWLRGFDLASYRKLCFECAVALWLRVVDVDSYGSRR